MFAKRPSVDVDGAAAASEAAETISICERLQLRTPARLSAPKDIVLQGRLEGLRMRPRNDVGAAGAVGHASGVAIASCGLTLGATTRKRPAFVGR